MVEVLTDADLARFRAMVVDDFPAPAFAFRALLAEVARLRAENARLQDEVDRMRQDNIEVANS